MEDHHRNREQDDEQSSSSTEYQDQYVTAHNKEHNVESSSLTEYQDQDVTTYNKERNVSQEPIELTTAGAQGVIPGIELDGGNLEKQITNKSAAPSVNNVKSIPNGGLRAWLQVLGAFFLFFNSWGIINCYGEYLSYYETGILSSSTPSDLSWIGSVQAFLLLFIGPLTGPVYDAGHFRLLLLTGTFFIVFGQMMLSLSTTYYQVFLSQAVCVGIGTGCLFVPSVAILSTYFNSKLASAMGIAASGSSLGGVVYPITLRLLITRIGFAWATRVLGFMSLATLLISISVMKVRVLPGARRKLLDLPAFTELPYLLFVTSGFVVFMGLYAPFFYVESFAIRYSITDTNLAFYTLAIINSASVFGRILPNFVANRTGPFNVIVPACIISGIIALCLIPVRTEGPLIVICLLYGFFSGALVSLPPTVFVHLSPNRAMIGTRMGMGFGVISIGLLLGTPICGWILAGSSFTYVWVFGGLLIAGGGLIMAASRISKVGWKINVRA